MTTSTPPPCPNPNKETLLLPPLKTNFPPGKNLLPFQPDRISSLMFPQINVIPLNKV